MKRTFAYFLLTALICVRSFYADPVRAQVAPLSIAGDYEGVLGTRHMRLHLRQSPSGALSGNTDIRDRRAFGIPAKDLLQSGIHISFAVPALHATFQGDISADGSTVKGIWTQGAPRPLVYTRIVPATAASLSAQLAQIDEMVSSDFAKNTAGSVTVGVVAGKELIWTKSFGSADTDRHLHADKDTVYRIGSITKMFTALMLEQLTESGKVHLSDPVEKYFPEVNTVQGRYPDAVPISLIQLAMHTSGLGREPDEADKYTQGPVAKWEATLIEALPHLHYAFEPGTRYLYSNMGYAVLGAALSRAAGQPYLAYVPSRIFTPLGMTHSALELNPALKAHLSTGYDLLGDKIDVATPLLEHSGRGYKVPNGAIYTTVVDLAKFASFVMGNGPESVLKTQTLESDQTQVLSDLQMTTGYGLGFGVTRRENYVAFGHGGDVAGYQSALYLNNDKGLGLIVLANATGPGSVDVENLALRSLDLLCK